jgi:hypothetical protein
VKNLISTLFRLLFDKQPKPNPHSEEEGHPLTVQASLKKNPDEIEFIWSLVGNIVDAHFFGEQKEIRRGTKHFSPGTKVYYFPLK